MNKRKSVLMSIMGMMGLGEQLAPVQKSGFRGSEKNKPKLGSLNAYMKDFREHEHGTMSRRVARTLVKAIRKDTARDLRIADRKSDPKRHLRFA